MGEPAKGWLKPAEKFLKKHEDKFPSTERDRQLHRLKVAIPGELLARASRYSVETGITRNSLVRRALHAYLTEHDA